MVTNWRAGFLLVTTRELTGWGLMDNMALEALGKFLTDVLGQQL